MATKPTATYVFAPQTLFTSGPYVGSEVKVDPAGAPEGQVPGTIIDPEFPNFMFNSSGLWGKWQEAGSSAAGEDAHIMETDADGTNSVAALDVGGTGSSTRSLVVNPNSGQPDISAIFQNNSAGTAIEASATGTAIAAVGLTGGRALDVSQDTDLATTVAPVRIRGRATEPTTVAEGDILFREGSFNRLGVYDGNFWGYVHTSAGGFVRRYGRVDTNTARQLASFTPFVTVAMTANDNLISGMTVHLRATLEIGANAAGTILQLALHDATLPTTLPGTTRTVETFQVSSAATERYVVLEADYVLPADGARTFELQFASNGSDTCYVRYGSLEITGQY